MEEYYNGTNVSTDSAMRKLLEHSNEDERKVFYFCVQRNFITQTESKFLKGT